MKRRDFLRNVACSSVACATGSALFTQLGMINAALAAQVGLPGVSAGRRLQGAGLPVPARRQRFVQPADPERRCALRDVRRFARRDGASRRTRSCRQRARRGAAARPTACIRAAPSSRACSTRAVARSSSTSARCCSRRLKTAVPDAGLSAAAAAFLACRSAGPMAVRSADRERIDRLGRPRGRSPACAESRRDDTDVDLADRARTASRPASRVQPYSISSAGPTALVGLQRRDTARRKLAALEALLAQTHPDPLTRTYASKMSNAIDYYNTMQTALARRAAADDAVSGRTIRSPTR